MACPSLVLDIGSRTLEDVPGVMASGSKLVVWWDVRTGARGSWSRS